MSYIIINILIVFIFKLSPWVSFRFLHFQTWFAGTCWVLWVFFLSFPFPQEWVLPWSFQPEVDQASHLSFFLLFFSCFSPSLVYPSFSFPVESFFRILPSSHVLSDHRSSPVQFEAYDTLILPVSLPLFFFFSLIAAYPTISLSFS